MSADILPTATATVVCRAVSHHYGYGSAEVTALRGVTATVSAGARIALTGPSGSGKSTLLHLMAGLESPTAGEMGWPGLGGCPAGRPGLVGVVFQGASLVPALDVAENVALPLLLADTRSAEADERAAAALRRLGLEELGAKLPEELSGGQAQRVAVARVLASRPRLVLADEPTGHLDRHTGAELVSVLLQAATELGAALVVATHDTTVAARLDHRWFMRDGRLATDGDAGSATDPGSGKDTGGDPGIIDSSAPTSSPPSAESAPSRTMRSGARGGRR